MIKLLQSLRILCIIETKLNISILDKKLHLIKTYWFIFIQIFFLIHIYGYNFFDKFKIYHQLNTFKIIL